MRRGPAARSPVSLLTSVAAARRSSRSRWPTSVRTAASGASSGRARSDKRRPERSARRLGRWRTGDRPRGARAEGEGLGDPRGKVTETRSILNRGDHPCKSKRESRFGATEDQNGANVRLVEWPDTRKSAALQRGLAYGYGGGSGFGGKQFGTRRSGDHYGARNGEKAPQRPDLTMRSGRCAFWVERNMGQATGPNTMVRIRHTRSYGGPMAHR